MFGASMFLLGAGAVGVPIAIHLLARQRTRVLPWGAMAFLRESVSTATSRRNRLRDLILLVLRCLAILFLALTFAQPLVSRLLFGGGDLETVFIWDVSLSTLARDERTETAHEHLRKTLLEEIERLPDLSRVRILMAGSEPRWLRDHALVLSSANRKSLDRAIKAQAPETGGSTIAEAILTALSVPGRDEVGTRQIVVLHDGQRQAWQAQESNRWRAIREALASDRHLSLRVLDAPKDAPSWARQVSIDRLETTRDTAARDAPVRFRASIRNHSASVIENPRVVWKVDGQEVGHAPGGEIPAGETLQIEKVLSFQDPGCHQVTCEVIDPLDRLPEDNFLTTIVSTQRALPLVIVDDTKAVQPGQILPSSFLKAAMGMHPNAKPGKKDSQWLAGTLFEPRVVGSDALGPETLAGCYAVVVANADSISIETIGSISRFVEEGGGLWLMMDSSWNEMPEWAVVLLDKLGLRALADTRKRAAEDSNSPMRIKASSASSEFAHQIAAERLDLHLAELRMVHEFQQAAFLDDEDLLRTRDGVPLLLSLKSGHGRVVLMTTDLRRANTNLPVLQSFVPLVRESVRESLRGALPQRNLDPLQPIRLPVLGRGESDGPFRVRGPDGGIRGMVPRAFWHEFSSTAQPGIYQLVNDGPEDPEQGVECFSVRRPAAESVLERIPKEEITSLIEADSALPPAAAEEMRLGRWPLAAWFAILTGLLFLAEGLLAHWLAGRRTASSSPIGFKPVF